MSAIVFEANQPGAIVFSGDAVRVDDRAAASFRGITSPEAYGAIGDGVTDDSAAINLAVASGMAVQGTADFYAIASTIQIPANAVLSCNLLWIGAANGIMAQIVGDGARVHNSSFDGDNTARIGIYDTAGGAIVEDTAFFDLRSTTTQVVGIHGYSAAAGSIYRRNTFDNLESVGDAILGNMNGACRAVLLQWTADFTRGYDVYENTARNIIGEEGDAFQILAITGTTFYSSAGSKLRNNKVVNPSKRGFKVQAHDTYVTDNIVKMLIDYGTGVTNCISVQSASRCIVSGNHVTVTYAGGRGIVLSVDAGAATPEQNQVVGNTVVTNAAASDLAIYALSSNYPVIADNHVTNGRVIAELSIAPEVSRNSFFNTLISGSDGCISFRSTCVAPVADSNVQHSGDQYTLVRSDCQRSTITRNITRSIDYVNLSAVYLTAGNNVIADNVNALTGVATINYSGATSAGAQIAAVNNYNLGM